jgi:hypothetical protein
MQYVLILTEMLIVFSVCSLFRQYDTGATVVLIVIGFTFTYVISAYHH